MMNDRTSKIIVGLILFKLTLVIGSCVGASSVEIEWKLEAAATECAQFNSSNGHFEWSVNEGQ